MNSIARNVVFFRSLATRTPGEQVPRHLPDIVAACKAAGYDLVIIETPGIGQGDAAIVPFVDVSLYVMTADFGAPSQLEKIDMLDVADVVAINKFERRGAHDALRDVARQLVRNREQFGTPWQDMPVFGTSAARFDDDGVTALYRHLKRLLRSHGLPIFAGVLPTMQGRTSTGLRSVLPAGCERYLADIAQTVRRYHATTAEQVELARRRQQLAATRDLLAAEDEQAAASVAALLERTEQDLHGDVRELLDQWPAVRARHTGDEQVYTVRGKEIRTPLTRITLSGTRLPRVALPAMATTGSWCASYAAKTCPDTSRSPPGCSPSNAPRRHRLACSPARATRFVPTAASICSAPASRPPGCRPRSTR